MRQPIHFKTSALLPALALLLAGCFSSTPKEEHFYQLKSPSTKTKAGSGPSVLVETFSTSPGYDSPRIAYRVSEFELRYYGYRQWVSGPAEMLTELASKHLRASGTFSRVGPAAKIRDPGLILEGNIDVIEEVDEGESWKARLAMTLVVSDGSSGRELLRHAFDVTRPCIKRHPDEVAREIGRIFEAQLKRLARRMAEAAPK